MSKLLTALCQYFQTGNFSYGSRQYNGGGGGGGRETLEVCWSLWTFSQSDILQLFFRVTFCILPFYLSFKIWLWIIHIAFCRLTNERSKQQDIFYDWCSLVPHISLTRTPGSSYDCLIDAQVPVPRSLIGVIIGKSGDMIKRIQDESGCRVQFKPEDQEMGGPTRTCLITGSPHNNETARNLILEVVDAGMVSPH